MAPWSFGRVCVHQTCGLGLRAFVPTLSPAKALGVRPSDGGLFDRYTILMYLVGSARRTSKRVDGPTCSTGFPLLGFTASAHARLPASLSLGSLVTPDPRCVARSGEPGTDCPIHMV